MKNQFGTHILDTNKAIKNTDYIQHIWSLILIYKTFNWYYYCGQKIFFPNFLTKISKSTVDDLSLWQFIWTLLQLHYNKHWCV